MSLPIRIAVTFGLLVLLAGPATADPKPMKACHVHYSGKVQGVGFLGLGMNHVAGLRALAANAPAPRARAVIYIFLSGGLAQQDSFDMKPAAAPEYRGEFKPIATRTPGIQVCEHLPRLAERSNL